MVDVADVDGPNWNPPKVDPSTTKSNENHQEYDLKDCKYKSVDINLDIQVTKN